MIDHQLMKLTMMDRRLHLAPLPDYPLLNRNRYALFCCTFGRVSTQTYVVWSIRLAIECISRLRIPIYLLSLWSLVQSVQSIHCCHWVVNVSGRTMNHIPNRIHAPYMHTMPHWKNSSMGHKKATGASMQKVWIQFRASTLADRQNNKRIKVAKSNGQLNND